MSLVSLIVARARNGVIGADGGIPWRLSSDMRRFKAITMGKPIVMGRKTWESFPVKPLPGRPNLVLTRDASFRAEGALVYATLDAALGAAHALGDEICIVGGGAIYTEAMPLVDRIYLTEVDAAPKGDTTFSFDESAYRETAREEFAPGPKDDHAFVIRTLERV